MDSPVATSAATDEGSWKCECSFAKAAAFARSASVTPANAETTAITRRPLASWRLISPAACGSESSVAQAEDRTAELGRWCSDSRDTSGDCDGGGGGGAGVLSRGGDGSVEVVDDVLGRFEAHAQAHEAMVIPTRFGVRAGRRRGSCSPSG